MKAIVNRLLEQPWRMWTPLWAHRKRARGFLLQLGLLTTFVVLITPGYGAANWFAAWRGVSILDTSIALDRAIPGWSWTMMFYSLYYPLFLLLCLNAPRTTRGRLECMLAFQALIVGALISFVFFIIAPVEVAGRDSLDDSSFFQLLFASLHTVDPPFNSWPSLHVLHSIIATWFIVRWRTAGRGRNARLAVAIPMWILCALISLSTLTTKQHYIWDVVSAAALASLILIISRRGLDSLDEDAIVARFEPAINLSTRDEL